jgi:hypothetical protein
MVGGDTATIVQVFRLIGMPPSSAEIPLIIGRISTGVGKGDEHPWLISGYSELN